MACLIDYSEVYFASKLDSRFRCPVCKNPLKEPVQIACGHRMCSECVQRIIRNPNPQCPQGKAPLNEMFKDACYKGEAPSLMCYCMNHKYGCDWKKELRYLKEHQRNCEYREVPCLNEGCEETAIPMTILDQHMKKSCPYEQSPCQHCGGNVQKVQIEEHLRKCEKVPITCQYCGMTNILRELEKDHIENDCEAAEKPCKFKYVGCPFKGKLEDLNEQYEFQKDEHLKLTVQSVEAETNEQDKLKERVEKAEKAIEKLEKELAEHRETLAANSQNLRLYQARLNKAEKTVADHKNAIAQIRERTEDAASSKAGKPSEVSLQLEEIRSALADQEEKLHSFEREFSRGSVAGGGPRSSFSSSSLTLDRRLDRNEHQLALHGIQLAEHNLKIQMLEATSYDGTYNWKIDEFSRRNHEGIIGKTPSIYSPPFYVGRYGYKVCARVYPNGDGMGKGTHLSLFFVIMKGEYDALLPWPFRQKVTFKLLDQDRQQDVTETFRPDPNSPNFKRPTSYMNIASGCPLFVSQDVLQSRSYVKDDTLFIKIIVDTAGLPLHIISPPIYIPPSCMQEHLRNCDDREDPGQIEGCEEKESCACKPPYQHCGKHVPEVQMEKGSPEKKRKMSVGEN